MSIEIKQVTTNRELKAFVQFPYDHFKGNAYFVPPLFFEEFNNLHWKKNPAFEYCEALDVSLVSSIVKYRRKQAKQWLDLIG